MASRAEDKPLASLIPDGEAEHTVEMIEDIGAPLLVPMYDHFSIASRAKGVTKPFELTAKLGEIIDFTIKDDPNGFLLIRHGLMAALKVDDRQTPEAKAESPRKEIPFVVRAPMYEGSSHGLESLPVQLVFDRRNYIDRRCRTCA